MTPIPRCRLFFLSAAVFVSCSPFFVCSRATVATIVTSVAVSKACANQLGNTAGAAAANSLKWPPKSRVPFCAASCHSGSGAKSIGRPGGHWRRRRRRDSAAADGLGRSESPRRSEPSEKGNSSLRHLGGSFRSKAAPDLALTCAAGRPARQTEPVTDSGKPADRPRLLTLE